MLLYSDTLPTRIFLAFAGWIWALSFATPGKVLDVAGFAWLGLIANEWQWFSAWLIYAIAKTWRILSGTRRVFIALVINFFGFLLFGMTAVATSFAVFPIPPVWPANIVLAMAALWLLVRTGLHNRDELSTE